MICSRAARAIGALALAGALAAQDPPEAVFRAETRLMQVEVKVRDKDGAAVRGLTSEDFRLTEDGKRQPIVSVDYVETPARRAPLGDGAAAAAREDDATESPRLWVYVANQSRGRDFKKGLDATEDFVRTGLTEGMRVSIGGAPFTEDRAALLRLTELMRSNPNGLKEGPEGYPVPAAIDPLVEQLAQLELQREATPRTGIRSTDNLPVDHLIDQNNRMALFRMLALVRQLSAYPGKKAVVLMRGGLRWIADNGSVADLLVGEANRNRISFYSMDTRGLEPIVPVGDRSIYGSPIRKLRSGRLQRERVSRIQASQHGIIELARGTGGRSVVNSNDFGLAFRNLVEDAGDYYVLSYTPTAEREEGLLRRIRVDATNDDWKLDYSRRYYEQQPFERMSKGERSVHLYRAMEFESEPARIRLRFNGHFFRDLEGRTTFVYSTAVHPSELRTREDGAVREVSYSVAAKATPRFAAPPTFGEVSRKETFDAERFELSVADSNAFVQHTDFVALEPGVYDWRIAWRDDASGEVGRFATELDVPDLSGAAVPSSLLVTRVASPIAEGAEPSMLDVGGMRLTPESPHEFRAGDTLHVLYDVYQVEEALLDAPAPMQFALMLGQVPVQAVEAKSQVFVGRDRGSLRYLAVLETDGLRPGDYTALALLPGEDRKPPYVYSTFRLIP